jgi:hypothetical protein
VHEIRVTGGHDAEGGADSGFLEQGSPGCVAAVRVEEERFELLALRGDEGCCCVDAYA